jgi:hypothetical protein
MTIDVWDPKGGISSQFGEVTSDYLRTLDIHLEAVPQGEGGCGGESLVVDLAIEQAASDVVKTQVPCGCL